jgi:hypothetical protein
MAITNQKNPNSRTSRIFSPEHGLRNQSRKELIEQFIFSFVTSFASLFICFIIVFIGEKLKFSNSLLLMITLPLILISFILVIFGTMCFTMIFFVKRKK